MLHRVMHTPREALTDLTERSDDPVIAIFPAYQGEALGWLMTLRELFERNGDFARHVASQVFGVGGDDLRAAFGNMHRAVSVSVARVAATRQRQSPWDARGGLAWEQWIGVRR